MVKRKLPAHNVKIQGTTIIASGAVIIEENKVLLVKDNKDDFFKLPGGSIEEGTQDLEKVCKLKVKSEINTEVEAIRPLHPKVLWENPQTKEKMVIVLVSFFSKLKSKEEIKPVFPVQEIRWFSLDKIEEWKSLASPYVQFLIEKGDIQ